MTALEFFETIEQEYSNYPKEEFVLAMRDLFDNFNHKKDFYYDLKQIYLDYCEEQNICPCCGSQLELVTWEEERSEYWGEPCYEMVSEEICTNPACDCY